MTAFDARLEALDTSLFAAIPSQTSAGDRRSLLRLQSCARCAAPYSYLEIGSYLGGSLQPHYLDPRCQRVYSIDKRPVRLPDQRGGPLHYRDNTTAHMRALLGRAFPDIDPQKVITFDSDAAAVPTAAIAEPPILCFIDGEHTPAAVCADFYSCLRVCHSDALLALHDSWIIFAGIDQIRAELTRRQLRFRGMLLEGSIYVFLLNGAVSAWESRLAPYAQDEAAYKRTARQMLWKSQLREQYPLVGTLARWVKRLRGKPRTAG